MCILYIKLVFEHGLHWLLSHKPHTLEVSNVTAESCGSREAPVRSSKMADIAPIPPQYQFHHHKKSSSSSKAKMTFIDEERNLE